MREVKLLEGGEGSLDGNGAAFGEVICKSSCPRQRLIVKKARRG